MANGTQYQKDKKNKYRPKAGGVGFKSSAGRHKNANRVCRDCGSNFSVMDGGARHQRKWLCKNCQPSLF